MENQYEFKGTTAPWRIAAKDYKKQYYVIHGIDTPTRFVQVLTINYGFHPIKEQLQRTQANAYLVAAAPDLLAACIDALARIKMNDRFPELQTQLQSAIEKALNIKNKS